MQPFDIEADDLAGFCKMYGKWFIDAVELEQGLL